MHKPKDPGHQPTLKEMEDDGCRCTYKEPSSEKENKSAAAGKSTNTVAVYWDINGGKGKPSQ
jgi:hypothetical protein